MNAPQHVTLAWPQAVHSWGPEEEDAAIAVIRSGRLTMGSQVGAFERAFASHIGVKHAVMVNSGSSANLIAVAALYHAGRIRPGGAAIVPAIAWATTYAPLLQYGLSLQVVDIERDTLNIDVERAAAAVTERTHAIVGVNLLGNPAALGPLRELADRHGLAFIEDNCEAMGAAYGGRRCGGHGDIGTFSFFFSHHLNTVEGGMLVTDDPELAELARCLRAHGWTRDVAADSALRSPVSDFDRDYDFALPGYNVRPTEIAAAVGLEQMKALPAMAAWRRTNADCFDRVLSDEWAPQQRTLGAVPFALPMVAQREGIRSGMIARLRELGAECRPIAGGCFAEHRAAQYYDWSAAGGLANARWVHHNGLMLGNHAADLRPQIEALAGVMT